MLAFTLLGTVTLALGTAPASATMQSSPVEQDYVNRINQLRSSLGLSVLIVDPELSDLARQHTPEMASAGRLYHTAYLTAGVTSNWQKLGENVGGLEL